MRTSIVSASPSSVTLSMSKRPGSGCLGHALLEAREAARR